MCNCNSICIKKNNDFLSCILLSITNIFTSTQTLSLTWCKCVLSCSIRLTLVLMALCDATNCSMNVALASSSSDTLPSRASRSIWTSWSISFSMLHSLGTDDDRGGFSVDDLRRDAVELDRSRPEDAGLRQFSILAETTNTKCYWLLSKSEIKKNITVNCI